MDQVLIVDNDQAQLEEFKNGLEKLRQFDVLTAINGESAVAVLKSQSVAVLVTEIDLAEMDGIELLAFMTRHYPSTPCIVMTGYGKPWFKKQMDQQDVLYHIEKPVELSALASAIIVGLNLKDEGLAHNGMTLSSFLPLIEVDHKTCRLDVRSPGKGKGYLYFEEGTLFDAHYRGKTGEQAAHEMASWDRIEIRFAHLPRRRSRKRIQTQLMDLAGATWLKEECPIGDPDEAQEAVLASPTEVLEMDGPNPIETTASSVKTALPIPPDLDAALKPHIKMLRTVKGYKAMAISNPHGQVIAYDSLDNEIDLSRLARSFKQAQAQIQKASEENGFEKCRKVTLHTTKGIIMLIDSAFTPQRHLQTIGVMAADGNWQFMKVQLESMITKVVDHL